MKNLGIVGIVALAVTLQLSLARMTVGGRWGFDLVLVAVVYVALRWGPTAGVIAGTLGGLTQDALAGTTIGVGGLSKTIVGFAAGVIGSQFIVTRPFPRMLLVAAASVMSRTAMWALFGVVGWHWPSMPWVGMLSETALNAAVAFAVYQGSETLPGLLRRRPTRRAFGARKW